MTVNFSAGPAMLPAAVLAEAQAELVDFAGTGMSLLETSHRSPTYEAVHAEAQRLAAATFGVPDDFSVLFLQGGATLQFAMVPINLLHPGQRGAYVASGSWAARAVADAAHHGDVYLAWDGDEHGFRRMPREGEVEIGPDTRYLHVTSNETIDGLQMHRWPDAEVPLVADMSSDCLSRPIPWERFDVVYAGAQKNLGPAGVTVVFVRDSILGDTRQDAASYLRYDVHQRARSLANTPAVFAVYLLGKTLRWIEAEGGLPAMEQRARVRSRRLYEVIDGSGGFYTNPLDAADRSLMNVVFRLPTEALDARFVADATAADLVGLKGHRRVGGCRASLYNAMSVEGAETLAEFMTAFLDANG